MEADGNKDGGDYLDMPPFMRIIMQSFRISIGDVQINQYGKWGDDIDDPDFKSAQPFAKLLIWIFWLTNLFFMLIIMLNFLIAEVSATYEKVKSQGETSVYRQRVRFNKQILQIKSLITQLDDFRFIAVEKPSDYKNMEDEEDLSSLAIAVKKNTEECIQKLKKRIHEENEILYSKIGDQSSQMSKTNEKLDQVLSHIHQQSGTENSKGSVNLEMIIKGSMMEQEVQIQTIKSKNEQIRKDFKNMDQKLNDLVILFLKMAEHLSQIPPYQDEQNDQQSQMSQFKQSV